jgi:hypothetical protein
MVVAEHHQNVTEKYDGRATYARESVESSSCSITSLVALQPNEPACKTGAEVGNRAFFRSTSTITENIGVLDSKGEREAAARGHRILKESPPSHHLLGCSLDIGYQVPQTRVRQVVHKAHKPVLTCLRKTRLQFLQCNKILLLKALDHGASPTHCSMDYYVRTLQFSTESTVADYICTCFNEKSNTQLMR